MFLFYIILLVALFKLSVVELLSSTSFSDVAVLRSVVRRYSRRRGSNRLNYYDCIYVVSVVLVSVMNGVVDMLLLHVSWL